MSNLNKIESIVVLMLENRSFDNVLGWLYDPENQPPFQEPPKGQTFDGLFGKNLSNPDPLTGNRVPVGKGKVMTDPNPDPGEEFEHVSRQLGGETMEGFVEDYIQVLQKSSKEIPGREDYQVIMNGFTPESLPVLSGLAHHYAVCDRWFCSVPSQTLCNRCFSVAATSRGFVNNSPDPKWLLTHSPTIFNRLEEAGLPWHVYYDELDIVPLTRLVQPTLWDMPHSRFKKMDDFHKDAAHGKLPPFSLIEPRFFLDHNDAHPPLSKKFLVTSSVSAAEVLVNEIYQSIRNGKGWEKTLLVITFDEHGGCYDHVPPPKAVPPGSEPKPGEHGFCFDRLGIRVPTILVSPWIPPGHVEHTEFCHTSLIKTVTQRWGLQSLTQRDAAANDLSPVLALDAPRTDRPDIVPLPYTPHPEHRKAPLLHLQRDILSLIACYEAAQKLDEGLNLKEKIVEISRLTEAEFDIHKLKTVGEAIDFMTTKLQPETGWFGDKDV